jgi:hypothetical protein
MKQHQPLTPKLGDKVLVRYNGDWQEGHLKSKPHEFQDYWEVWVPGGRIAKVYQPEDISFIHYSEWWIDPELDY